MCAFSFRSPCGHSCTISLCKVSFALWWLLYKSRASRRAIEGCLLFIVSLVDCWTLRCCFVPIRFGRETIALETLRRNYLLVINSTLLQSRPHCFTFMSSWGQSKVWVNWNFFFFFFLQDQKPFWTRSCLKLAHLVEMWKAKHIRTKSAPHTFSFVILKVGGTFFFGTPVWMQQIIELIFAPRVVNNNAVIGFAIGSKLEGVFLLDHSANWSTWPT